MSAGSPVREIARSNSFFTFEFANAVTPTKFCFIGRDAVFSFFAPAECNGETCDLVLATDEDGTGAAIPLVYIPGTGWTTYPQIDSLTTGQPVILMAEAMAGHYLGLKIGSAVTCDITLYRKG